MTTFQKQTDGRERDNGHSKGRKAKVEAEERPSGLNQSRSVLPDLMDVEALACHLSVTVHHVRRLVQERRIPYLKVGVFVRFDPREVDTWLEECRIPELERYRPRGRKPVK